MNENSRFGSERAQRWFDRINNSNHILWLIFVISFLETIIIPIPIEMVLIPLLVLNRHRVWTMATVTTAGCLAAALLGYGVGMVLYESVGLWFIETLGYGDAYAAFQKFFDKHGFVAILTVGILPIPFQIAMITAGLSGYPILLFALAAVIARGIRYYGLAWIVKRFGNRATEMWRQHALLSSFVAGGVVLAIYVVMQFLASKAM